MINKPWYIWFSVVAFLLLSIDTERKIMFNRVYRSLWNSASWNLVKLWGIYIMLLPLLSGILLSYLVDMILRLFSVYVPEDSLINSVMQLVLFIFIYVGGVYATYRHALWRREHI